MVIHLVKRLPRRLDALSLKAEARTFSRVGHYLDGVSDLFDNTERLNIRSGDTWQLFRHMSKNLNPQRQTRVLICGTPSISRRLHLLGIFNTHFELRALPALQHEEEDSNGLVRCSTACVAHNFQPSERGL